MGRLAILITQRLTTILDELLICKNSHIPPSQTLEEEYKDAVYSVHILYFYQSYSIEINNIDHMINTLYGLLKFLRPKLNQ